MLRSTPRLPCRVFALLLVLSFALMTRGALGQCSNWRRVSEIGPSERHYAATAYDSRRGVMLLFGGRACCPWEYLGDTWQWDGSEWTLVATDGPSARYLHGMAYDSRRDRIVLFGGFGQYADDTWEWGGSAWMRVATTGPADVSGPLVYDEARGVTVFFGSDLSSRAETWTWDGLEWRLASQSGPPPRNSPGMAYDAARERVVLFGGWTCCPTRYLSDTWEWDGREWTLVATGGVPARTRARLAYDPNRGVTLLLGGLSGGYVDDFWAWDGVGWTQLAPDLGGEWGQFDTLAVDSARGRAVTFGGWGTDTRTLECDPQLWLRRSPQTLVRDLGERAEFSSLADGSGPLKYQWYLKGRRLADVGPFSGTRTPTLVVDPVVGQVTGAYTVEVSAACGSIVSSPAHLIVVDPVLDLVTDCFLSNRAGVRWQAATPRGLVYLLYARQPGNSVIPPGYICSGTPLGLDRASTVLALSRQSSFIGDGIVVGTIDPSACGGYLQLVDGSTCRTSNVAQIE